MSATDFDQAIQPSEAVAKGPIAYFAENRVAANLVMLVLLVGGVIAGSQLSVQGFPDVDHRTVTVRVPSPGTSPEEVEQDINRRIEESVIGIPGVERVVGTATEGLGQINIEVAPFADPTLCSTMYKTPLIVSRTSPPLVPSSRRCQSCGQCAR